MDIDRAGRIIDIVSLDLLCQYMDLLGDRKYGSLRVGSLLIALVFGFLFALVIALSWTLLEANDDTLAKISTVTSVGGVCLGTYIAVWLINQNHRKAIKNNYFYKLELLTVVNVILRDVDEFNKKLEMMTAKQSIKNAEKITIHNQRKYALEILVSQYEKLLMSINSNIPAPRDIRSKVNLLIFKIYSAIAADLKNSKQLPISFGPQLWTDQDELFNLPYFTTDHSEQIQKKLREMKCRWLNIKPQ